jgi:pyruvate dehydrogenase E1 component alpha subunit/2-oxoisovalerate dehydrogenase E1 component alpha subunit
MAAKSMGDRLAVIAFLGDGATSTADFHAALNFAGVFRVPCVFICQNNQLAISVPFERQTAAESIAIKARAYGLEGERVDGNDWLQVRAAVRAARVRAVEHQEPRLLECVTYRMAPHSSSDDPSRYRSDEVFRTWGSKDPIQRVRRVLSAVGELDEGLDAELTGTLTQELEQAIARVEGSPPVERESLFDDVYAEQPEHLREQRDALRHAPPARP